MEENPDDIAEEIATRSSSASDVHLLEALLLVKDTSYGKHVFPRLVCRGLLQRGADGPQRLRGLLPDAPGAIYPLCILEALFYAGRGEYAGVPEFSDGRIPIALKSPIQEDTALAAKSIIHDLLIESRNDDRLLENIMFFLHQRKALGDMATVRQFLNAFTEGAIRLTRKLIEEFAQLINAEEGEEVYQTFLKNNPVFLDPLASRVISKQQFGNEFCTDFVINRLDNEYILVELEKPQNKILTGQDDFSADFTHALGQIIDFQQWVDENTAYARKLMPGISVPKGLLVIGRLSALSERQKNKLAFFRKSLHNVDVRTYDEILQQSKDFYNNLVLGY